MTKLLTVGSLAFAITLSYTVAGAGSEWTSRPIGELAETRLLAAADLSSSGRRGEGEPKKFTFDELLTSMQTIVFGKDTIDTRGTIPARKMVHKWTKPIEVEIFGRPKHKVFEKFVRMLFVEKFAKLTGLRVSAVSNNSGKGNLRIGFFGTNNFQRMNQKVKDEMTRQRKTLLEWREHPNCFPLDNIYSDKSLKRILVFINNDATDGQIFACLNRLGFYSLGLRLGAEEIESSSFGSSEKLMMTEKDHLMIRLFYDQSIYVGMNRKEFSDQVSELLLSPNYRESWE